MKKYKPAGTTRMKCRRCDKAWNVLVKYVKNQRFTCWKCMRKR